MLRLCYCLVVFVTLMSAFGCKSKNDPALEPAVQPLQIKPKVEKAPEIGSFSGDTINLSGSFVVFFGPPMNIDDASAEIKEFHRISKIIIDSLQQNSTLFSTFSSVNNLRIYDKTTGIPMVIMRNTFSEPVGVIISDGIQSPVIKKGSGPIEEFHKIINSRFTKPS
jgi:hypothetical protein